MQALRIDPAMLRIETSFKSHQEALRIATEPFASIKLPQSMQEMMRIQTDFDEFARIVLICTEI
jgi:hypothetical protein